MLTQFSLYYNRLGFGGLSWRGRPETREKAQGEEGGRTPKVPFGQRFLRLLQQGELHCRSQLRAIAKALPSAIDQPPICY